MEGGGAGVEVGAITADDLEAISALHVHFWGEPSDVGEMTRALERLGTDPNHILLAARDDGQCIGTATGVVCHGLYGGFDSYLVVEDVVVDPAHRRKGVATALLGALEQAARERDCQQVMLLTESVRDDAVALYRSAGYSERWTGFKKKL
jgi:GNAT superfamily N-acetyltransferase